MSKLFLLTSNKCLSNSFHTEWYHLNANMENYFPFNILRAKERNFEVYLNPGNIALAFLELASLFQTCFKAIPLYEVMCICWIRNLGKLLNNSISKKQLIRAASYHKYQLELFSKKTHQLSYRYQNVFVILHNQYICLYVPVYGI